MTVKEENEFKTDIISILVFLITFAPLILFNGWGLSLMYKWWILPITNIKLTFVNCVGINCFIGYLKPINNTEEKSIVSSLFQSFARTLMILGINYLMYIILV